MLNGRVYVPHTAQRWAQALAIRDGRIVAVGDTAAVRREAGGQTRIVDLGGATVLPGLHDMHVHPLFGGTLYAGADPASCTIEQGSRVDALLAALARCVARVPKGQWLTGGQWDASVLGDALHHRTLDAVSPDHPVILNDTSGHSAWANALALELGGVDRSTPDPKDGIIERDARGNPTGILREQAIGLVRGQVPPPNDEVLRAALEWSLRRMLSYGITSFVEASNGFVAGSGREAGLYARLADAGVLKQRVQLCLNWLPDNWAPGDDTARVLADREHYERERLRTDCVKIFLDGVPTDSHTAAMLEPYAGRVAGRDDRASRYGMLLVEQDTLNRAVTDFDQRGLTVKFHAAGDAAVHAALDAIEAARRANGMSGIRHNPGHCTFIAHSDLSRAAALGATLELSPYLWSPSPINDDITHAIGEPRIGRAWPFREALDAGALVVPGSDWAVVPSVNPWTAIEALLTRERPGGSPDSFGKREAITLAEAIDLFTINSARQLGREDRLGSLRQGYLADLVVLDRNPFDVPPRELHTIATRMTMIGGEIVYRQEDTVLRSASGLEVTLFRGEFASVNSFIVSNGRSQVLIDVQRKTAEARKLLDVVRSKGLPLTHILITHGHTDHFTGMPVFRAAYPDAQIVVANEDIKRDIKAYAIYMNSGGETGAEPALERPLVPQSAQNPAGFDYESNIHVLAGNRLELDGGGTLELTTDYKPAEADHIATVYIPELNALFLSDLAYNGVHLWMGDDISWQDIANWQEELRNIKQRYAARSPTVFPGHGEPADLALLDTIDRYIDDYRSSVRSSGSRAAAQEQMTRLYPGWREADFFLRYSLENHMK
ncbi:MAG: amidohydrolase family protein [Gammaproteobacteria bacterium]|nr:amidohydrolase family protein [Gammaproteobacteria bacterium]